MRVSKHRSLSFGIGFLALLAMIMATSASAFAVGPGGTVTTTITGGTLALSGVNASAPNLTLNGTDQSLAITMPITVTDPTGSGAGWHVNINATLFTDTNTVPDTFATNMTISGTTAAADVTAPDSVVPANNITPLLVTTSAQSMFSAAISTGMGKIDLTPTTSVPVPPTTVPGTYTSIITLALVSAP